MSLSTLSPSFWWPAVATPQRKPSGKVSAVMMRLSVQRDGRGGTPPRDGSGEGGRRRRRRGRRSSTSSSSAGTPAACERIAQFDRSATGARRRRRRRAPAGTAERRRGRDDRREHSSRALGLQRACPSGSRWWDRPRPAVPSASSCGHPLRRYRFEERTAACRRRRRRRSPRRRRHRTAVPPHAFRSFERRVVDEPEQRGEVAAGGLTPRADAVRIDAEVVGEAAKVPHGRLRVVQLGGEGRLTGVPVVDRRDGQARVDGGLEEGARRPFIRGSLATAEEPRAAVDPHDARRGTAASRRGHTRPSAGGGSHPGWNRSATDASTAWNGCCRSAVPGARNAGGPIRASWIVRRSTSIRDRSFRLLAFCRSTRALRP